jgi:hypothetical protein
MMGRDDQEAYDRFSTNFERAISAVARNHRVTPWAVIDACESLKVRFLAEILDRPTPARDRQE